MSRSGIKQIPYNTQKCHGTKERTLVMPEALEGWQKFGPNDSFEALLMLDGMDFILGLFVTGGMDNDFSEAGQTLRAGRAWIPLCLALGLSDTVVTPVSRAY